LFWTTVFTENVIVKETYLYECSGLNIIFHVILNQRVHMKTQTIQNVSKHAIK